MGLNVNNNTAAYEFLCKICHPNSMGRACTLRCICGEYFVTMTQQKVEVKKDIKYNTCTNPACNTKCWQFWKMIVHQGDVILVDTVIITKPI